MLFPENKRCKVVGETRPLLEATFSPLGEFGQLAQTPAGKVWGCQRPATVALSASGCTIKAVAELCQAPVSKSTSPGHTFP